MRLKRLVEGMLETRYNVFSVQDVFAIASIDDPIRQKDLADSLDVELYQVRWVLEDVDWDRALGYCKARGCTVEVDVSDLTNGALVYIQPEAGSLTGPPGEEEYQYMMPVAVRERAEEAGLIDVEALGSSPSYEEPFDETEDNRWYEEQEDLAIKRRLS